ncbi:putative cytochrome P450 hydroxylase [Enhygromyxa salina]|uniref:Putative cytochrome P450 hydroxylase n=1 Tax=Enhygromyxa salina TaxID=215803 RepID=A0A0C1Z5V9_9BACT|nr:cytochrome P450 [Enhygromyxa salina]KIG13004.1 putative cytochrome P450 hydroxylase [Enhygromyxa salina]
MPDTASDPFGLLDPGFRTNPYPALARLRSEAPVYYCDAWGCWVVARHDDVTACFRDDRLSADRASSYAAKLPPPLQTKLAPLIGNFGRWALMKDPPDHTRLRGLVSKAFTPRLITTLEPSIERICERALDQLERQLAEHGGFDLIHSYAMTIPVLVIGDMLGLPAKDGPKLERWSAALAGFLGAAAMTQEVVGAALQAVVELEAYFRDQIEQRRRAPADDLLSSLLTAHEQDDRLDEQELLATCTMVLFGGHETTTNLIGNGVQVLLQHPKQLAELGQDFNGQIAAAVEELLRFESPILRMGRIARAPIELRDATIAAGDRVYMMLAAANRDPEVFDDPDRLVLNRADNRHLTFGHGRHFCLGAALGRLEAQLALSKLFTRFPTLGVRADFTPIWLDNLTVRGLERLPLELR